MISNKKPKRDLSLNTNIFSSKLVCYLFPFAIFGGYLVYCILEDRLPFASGYYLIHYVYTYKHGFISRGLVGEVISWFADIVTDDLTKGVIAFFSALLMFFSSLCIGKALSKVRDDKERFIWVLFIVIMIYILPMPFKYYYLDTKLDKLVWALTLFAVYISDSKIGIWFVPTLCIIATLVNPVFLFCSMILISIILLQEFHSNGYSRKNGIICGISYGTMIVLGILAPVSEKWVGFDTPEELLNYYFSRYAGEIDANTLRFFAEEWVFDYFEPIDEIVKRVFNIYFKQWGLGVEFITHFVLIAVPFYFLISLFWKKIIKAENNKFQKFIYFLCAISPIVIIPTLIISWEFSKYFYNNILVQSGLVIYFIVQGHPAVLQTVKDIIKYCKKNAVVTAIVLIYFSTYLANLFDR